MFQIFKVLKSELFYSVLFCHQLYQHQQSRLGRTCNYLLSIAFETKTFNLASLAIPNCNPHCSYRFLNAASTRTCYSRSRYRTIGSKIFSHNNTPLSKSVFFRTNSAARCPRAQRPPALSGPDVRRPAALRSGPGASGSESPSASDTAHTGLPA